MKVLSDEEDLILIRFHEKERDRTGAQVGETLPAKELLDLKGRNPELDFEAGLVLLVERGYLERLEREGEGEGESYRFTQKAWDYLYTKQVAHV